MIDGAAGPAGASAGSGYQRREDRLEAGIKLHVGKLGLEIEGLLQDEDRGLQRQTATYVSHAHRRGDLGSRLELPLGERFTLSAEADASFASQLLSGPIPKDTTEVLAEPSVSLEFRHKSIWLALEGNYSYRDLLTGAVEALHRTGVQAVFGAEFLENYRFEARGGWMWNSHLGHLFHFSLALSGTPFSTFSFQLSGGYRVVPTDFGGLMEGFALPALPAVVLEDNHGWFADLGMSFTLTRNLSLQAQTLLAWNSALLQPDGTGIDPATGLFSIPQAEAVQLNTDARLRWNLGALVTLSAGVHTEFLDRPAEAPLHSGIVEIEGNDAATPWGGRGRLEFAIGDADIMPLLSISGFFNVTDTISMIAEIEDLLQPIWEDNGMTTRLPSGGLYSWIPYEAPGLRGTVKVQINL